MITTGSQLRAARALLRLEQAELAGDTGLSVATIRRLEQIDGLISDAKVGTLRDLTAAFARRGVTFGDGDRPSVAIEAGRLSR